MYCVYLSQLSQRSYYPYGEGTPERIRNPHKIPPYENPQIPHSIIKTPEIKLPEDNPGDEDNVFTIRKKKKDKKRPWENPVIINIEKLVELN